MPSSIKGWILLALFLMLVWYVYKRFVAAKVS